MVEPESIGIRRNGESYRCWEPTYRRLYGLAPKGEANRELWQPFSQWYKSDWFLVCLFVCLFHVGVTPQYKHTSWRGWKGAYPFSIREVLCGSGEQQTHVFLTEVPIGNRGTAGNRHMLYKQRYYWPHQSIQGSPAQFTNSILKSRSPHSPFKYLLIPPLCGSPVATLTQARVLR